MRIGALFADLRIRGIFGAHEDVYFDFRVSDADASSAATSDLRTILNRNEAEKIRKYRRACNTLGARFMPFVITAAEGIPSSQATGNCTLEFASRWVGFEMACQQGFSSFLASYPIGFCRYSRFQSLHQEQEISLESHWLVPL